MIGPLGVSNLAWPADALEEALVLLRELGITAIELAPHAVFGTWEGIAAEARALHRRLDGLGIEVTALQGILFGAGDMALFGTPLQRAALDRHLEHVASLAGLLGARACVFGAPKQRDPGGLSAADAREAAILTLRQVGPAFDAVGSALAFEPNAAEYGCRFITTTAEAVSLVDEVATPGIALQIDTGTILLEREPPSVLHAAAALAAHAHISEPGLRPVGGAEHGPISAAHAPIAAALREGRYAGSISIEQRAGPDWQAALRRAVAFARATYL